MSFYNTYKTWGELLKYLEEADYPKCFRVNYLPDEEEYALWIGNQPYETYEEIIEDVYGQLAKAREKNDGHIALAREINDMKNHWMEKANRFKEDAEIEKNHKESLGQSNREYQKDWERRGRKILKLQNELRGQSEFYEESLQEKDKENQELKAEINKWKLSDYQREQEVNNLKYEIESLKEQRDTYRESFNNMEKYARDISKECERGAE
jgi:chromosome segregation ATPase